MKMDALTHAKMSRQIAINELNEERCMLPYADGPAQSQSNARITDLYKTVSDLDNKIKALTEAELFNKDREAAINRAVQIKQIKLIQTLLVECWSGANNEAGLTTTRYVMIGNELSRALKELEA
jgi:hypothetical protein